MRTADAMLSLISGVDCVNNFAFLPRDGFTFCNCLLTVYTAALGCPVPPKKANGQAVWLVSNEGKLSGWMPVDSETARQRAQLGYPTVAALANPTGHGHVALVVPAPASDMGHMYVSAAGAENFIRARIERSFGLNRDVRFFTHA